MSVPCDTNFSDGLITREEAHVRIAVVQEEAHVTKHTVGGERVRVAVRGDTYDTVVDGTLSVEALEVERRPMDRPVDVAPPPRQEGDAMIISIVEERAVVTRQLFVIEEVVVRARATVMPFSVPVELRRNHVSVERTPAPSSVPDQGA